MSNESSHVKIGVQIQPQHTEMDAMRSAWRSADAMGLDSIWTWDHFYPLYGPPDGEHFEGWTSLAAMAADTSRASVGMLVTCNSYRNPELLADMARTVDHISGGRCVLGIGAGWFERDYDEYGFEFGTAGSRLAALETSITRIKDRTAALNPQPLGTLPMMIGGGGERKTLRLVAQYAQLWNGFGPVETWAHKNRVLTSWCEQVGRNPAEVERTLFVNNAKEIDSFDDYLAAGVQHFIFPMADPFDFAPVESLLARAGR